MAITIRDDFPEFSNNLQRAVEAGVRDAAFQIEREATQRAPVATGYLRGSIGSEYDTNGAAVSANAEYALYQEEGTKYIKGKHFLKDAFDEVVPDQLEAFIRRHM